MKQVTLTAFNNPSLSSITLIEDSIHKDLCYYIPSEKYENIIFVFGSKLWAYCKICNKFVSRDGSNLKKHQLARHTTAKQWEQNLRDVMKLFIELNAPNAIVENQTFRKVFPDLPKDRRTIDSKFKQLYKSTKENVRQYLKNVDKINLYIDKWTRFGLNFVGIFCSTEKRDALLTCSVPKDLSRKAETLSKFLKKNLISFGIIDDINFCSSDCAKNVAKAVNMSDLMWLPCCCHVVNKALEKALARLPLIKEIQNKVTALNASTKLKQYLISVGARFLTIPAFSPTRWLSIGQMLCRLRDQSKIILDFINSEYNINHISFSDDEFIIIKIFADIIEEINKCILELESKEKSGFFYALLTLMKITNIHAKSLINNGFIEAGEVLRDYIIQKLINEKEWTNHLFIAALLNPNINIEQDDIIPQELKKYMKQALHKIFESIPAVQRLIPSPSTFGMRSANVEENEYDLYRKLPYPGTVDIIEFWNSHSIDLPNVFNLAKKYFGLYPSSTCIERTFSMAKEIMANKFGALSPKKVQQKIFLYVNEDFIP